ncbi:MAG: transporter [Firmicutes bacterium CAG:272_52_7]|nr:MAG: transporter [Firmicutes bacterium CAG:272_52_7]
MNPENIRNIIALAVLILMSGYFSATETAFLSCNKTRLRTMAEKGNKRAALVNRLNENYDRLLSTILIGNNIVNLTAASIGTVLFVRLYGDIGATVSTAVINVAKDCPEKLAMFSAPIIRVLIWIFTPLNFLFGLWKKLVSKVLHLESDSKMSQEELLMLVEEVREGGTIDSEEGDLLKNAIEFNDMRAEDILTHRVDLEAVDIESTKEEIAEVFTQSKFARLPVYEDSIDNIIGILNMKDFYDGTGITAKSIRDIMTKPLFVLKSEKIDELLKLLQETKSQMAVILDEYGGTLGIVTLEDILEELVGEIWDEHDEVTEEYIPIGENRWRVDCSVNLDDFCDFFGIETDSTTISLGGWVMEQLGKVPEAGDSFEFECLSVSVVETDGQRVTFIDVEKKPEEAEEE